MVTLFLRIIESLEASDRRIAELEAEKAAAKGGDGWIKWDGGKRPVHPDTMVEVKMREGGTTTARATGWRWRHISADGDIVAYRCVHDGACR